MDIKRVLKGCKKIARRTRSKRNAKDTDSGISSASSTDTTDAIELPPFIISGVKVEDIVEGKCNAFSPVVILERSEEVERQLRQMKESLDLHVHSDDQLNNTHGDSNKTDKDLINSDNFKEPNKSCIIKAKPPIDSSGAKAKYNLRRFDKRNVPRRFRDSPPPENINNTDTVNLDNPPIKNEPILHNIKIVRDLSSEIEKSIISLIPFDHVTTPENKVIEPKRQRKRRPTKIGRHLMKTGNSEITTHHRKVWKRSNDVPSEVDCITSHHKIFEGAVLEEISYKHLLFTNIKVETDSKSETSIRDTPERTTSENISLKTPEKKEVDSLNIPIPILTPPQIKITFSTNLNNRTVKKINFLSSPQSKMGDKIFDAQNQSKRNNNIDISCSTTANSNSSDSENVLQEVTEPRTYEFNKLGSRLERFNAAKLRENVDKPVNDHRSQKRNTLSINESPPSKKNKTVDIVNTNEKKEIDNEITSPKKLLKTPPKPVKETILSKSGPETSDDGTTGILERSPAPNIISSPNESLIVTPPAITTIDETLKKCSTQEPLPNRKLFIKSPECVKNFQPIQFHNNNNNNKSEVNCATFDLRQRINGQRNKFKTPHLPLTKRPPTRRSTAEVLDKLNQSATGRNHSNQDSDVISLYAESFYEVEYRKQLNEPCNINNDEDQTSEIDLLLCPEEKEERQESPTPDIPIVEVPKVYNESRKKSITLDVPIEELPEVTMKCNRSTTGSKSVISQKLYSDHAKLTENCKPTVQGVQESNFSVLQSPSSENTSVDKDILKVSEWMASTSNEILVIPYEKLDSILKRFCHHHYNKGKCNYFYGKCKFSHCVPEYFKKMIMDLSPNQFKYMYNYVLKKLRYLFTEIFYILVNYIKDQEKALIDMVKDVIHVTHLEKKPFVIVIISALKNLGLSFNFVLEEIFIAHSKERWLVEILLDVVVNDESCLQNNWCFVQKLINSLQNNLDYGIISDIFNKCININPPNKEFCKNVYIDLIVMDRLNLSLEPKAKINKYVNLLRSFCLFEYVNHIRVRYNIRSNEEPVNAVEQSDVDEEREPSVDNTDIKELTFSDSSSDMSLSLGSEPVDGIKEQTNSYMNLLSDANSVSNSFDPYIPAIQEQSITEYIPTQPFTAFNSHNQSYNYRKESLVQQNSEEAGFSNPKYASNYLVGAAKTISKRIPNVKDDGLQASQHWASNKSASSSDIETQSTLNDVANNDIMKLCMALKQTNISMILSLFAKYSSPNLSKSFVIHLIIALKNLNDPSQVEDIVKNIFCYFESLCTPSLALNQTHLLQLFGFNMLTYLDYHRKYEGANIILKKFPDDYSDFITIECLETFEYLSTTNLRYLFIFKVLTRNGKFRDALMFLKSLSLNMNDSVLSDENPEKYLEYKKRLICEFIDDTLRRNISVAKEMLCFINLEVRSCRCIDFEKYSNLLIINMLNHYSECKLELRDIFQIIINSWYKYLRGDVLRALFIQLYHELPDLKILELYQMNVRSKVYPTPEGITNSITIPSNLMNEEIYILLHLYFHKLSKNNYPFKNIIIDIKPVIQEEVESTSISILTNSRTNCTIMKTRILNVLQKLPYPPVSCCTESDQYILLAFEDMRALLTYYRTEYLPPLQKFR